MASRELGNMSKKDIVGSYQTTILRHYDGNQRTVFYTDKESKLAEGEKICSCSDSKGYITTANSAFIRMSGYSKEELIGMPHYILHHPDMPKATFSGLWRSLKETGRWEGYVKNLRKDGGFYWVHANIFSNFRNGQLVGYTSSRSGVSNEQIAICESEYQQLLRAEERQ